MSYIFTLTDEQVVKLAEAFGCEHLTVEEVMQKVNNAIAPEVDDTWTFNLSVTSPSGDEFGSFDTAKFDPADYGAFCEILDILADEVYDGIEEVIDD